MSDFPMQYQKYAIPEMYVAILVCLSGVLCTESIIYYLYHVVRESITVELTY